MQNLWNKCLHTRIYFGFFVNVKGFECVQMKQKLKTTTKPEKTPMFDRVCISQKIKTFLFESVLINSAMQTLQAFISGGSSMILG